MLSYEYSKFRKYAGELRFVDIMDFSQRVLEHLADIRAPNSRLHSITDEEVAWAVLVATEQARGDVLTARNWDASESAASPKQHMKE